MTRSRAPQGPAGSSRYTMATTVSAIEQDLPAGAAVGVTGGASAGDIADADVSGHCIVDLWGFGLACRHEGTAVFLGRYQPQPEAIAVECLQGEIWTPDALRPAKWCADRHPQVSAMLLRWIVRYERWVLSSYGTAYRQDVLRRWQPRMDNGFHYVAPLQVPRVWAEWSEQFLG